MIRLSNIPNCQSPFPILSMENLVIIEPSFSFESFCILKMTFLVFSLANSLLSSQVLAAYGINAKFTALGITFPVNVGSFVYGNSAGAGAAKPACQIVTIPNIPVPTIPNTDNSGCDGDCIWKFIGNSTLKNIQEFKFR